MQYADWFDCGSRRLHLAGAVFCFLACYSPCMHNCCLADGYFWRWLPKHGNPAKRRFRRREKEKRGRGGRGQTSSCKPNKTKNWTPNQEQVLYPYLNNYINFDVCLSNRSFRHMSMLVSKE